MKYKYFDNWDFKQAHDCIKDDPLTAKKMFEDYLEDYPYDYSAYSYYISVLITLNQIDEAQRFLVLVNKAASYDKKYRENKKKVKIFEDSMAINTMRILGYQERYKELKQYYDNINNERLKKEFQIIPLLCEVKLNKKINNTKEKYPYLYRQIINYSEEEFRNHIKKHLSNDDNNDDKYSESIFAEDFPIDKIIEETKKYIPSTKPICKGFFDNRYVFKYNECGRDGKKLANFFEIITFHNSSNYITMYPSTKCENLPYINLNYMITKKEIVKTKTPTQIDKFNKRYNKKGS